MSRTQEERRQVWRRLIAEQEQSGLSVRAFSKQRRISEHSFYQWRRRLGEQLPIKFALVETSFIPKQIEEAIEIGRTAGQLKTTSSNMLDDPSSLDNPPEGPFDANSTVAGDDRRSLPREAQLSRDTLLPPRRGDVRLLQKANGDLYESVAFRKAAEYLLVGLRRVQQLAEKDGLLEVVGGGQNRRIVVKSLIRYCPPY